MEFSILDKELLKKDEIKRIVRNVKERDPIFRFDQSLDLYKSSSGMPGAFTELLLKDYNPVKDDSFSYIVLKDAIVPGTREYLCVLPVVKFKEIRDNSQIISETDDTITVQSGRYFTSRINGREELQKIDLDARKYDIFDTNRKITISIDSSGKKTKLRVFQNEKTGEEYVFMKKNADETYDDSLDVEATFVGAVSPLTWTVDKKTGLAICNNPLFFSEKHRCPYDETALAQFLESEEFAEELGISSIKTKEMNTNNPFGQKDQKLSIEQKIRRVLMGEKRIPYLVGHPGVGKTQIAKSINKNCLPFNIATFTPDTFTGKTSIVPGDKIITKEGDKTVEHHEKGRTTTAEPEWYTKLIAMSNERQKRNERCIILLDEFDKLTPNMQVFINGIVDSPRTIAGWEIPDNVDIILAGNTEEYSDAAFKISGEVASRLTKLEASADAPDWLKWASKHDVDPIVKAYIYSFPNKLIQDVKDDAGDYNYSLSLTPRSWDQKISEELKASRKIKSFPYLEPYMDGKNQKEFERFIEMYFKLGVEEILKGNFPPETFDLAHDRTQLIINCLTATANTEDEIYNSLLFIQQSNLNEYQALFEQEWIKIHDSDDDILKLKLAKNHLNERRTGYGK